MLKEDTIKKMLSEYADSRGKALEEAQYTEGLDRERLYNRLREKIFKRYYALDLALAVGAVAAAVFIICLLNVGKISSSSSLPNLTLEESRVNYSSAELPVGERVYLPLLLPRGFVLRDSTPGDNILTLEYGLGEYNLSLTQALNGGDFTDKSELEGMQRISIAGDTGYLLEAENGYKQLIWFKEGASLALVGNIDTEAMAEIAENVTCAQ